MRYVDMYSRVPQVNVLPEEWHDVADVAAEELAPSAASSMQQDSHWLPDGVMTSAIFPAMGMIFYIYIYIYICISLSLDICVYIYIYIYNICQTYGHHSGPFSYNMCMYIYIYIERERERYRHIRHGFHGITHKEIWLPPKDGAARQLDLAAERVQVLSSAWPSKQSTIFGVAQTAKRKAGHGKEQA